MNKVFKALAHPVRRKVLTLLQNGPMLSGDIADAFDLAWPTMTAHLTQMKEAGLVSAERRGTNIHYRLNASVMEEAAGFLLTLAKIGEPAGAIPAPVPPHAQAHAQAHVQAHLQAHLQAKGDET